jgi:outer membrane protein assembly factor BamB
MTTPIVADGLVIAGTGTSRVLSQTRSTLIWGRPGGDDIVAFSAGTGRVRWRYHTVGENMPSPALVRTHGVDAIVFANGDDRIRAIGVRTGKLLWQRDVPGIASMSSAAAQGGRVYVVVGGAADSNIGDSTLAIDPQNGNVVWRAPFGNSDCSPTVAFGRVFVQGSASDSRKPAGRNAFNEVAAIDESTGKLRWRWYSGYGTFTGVGSDEQAIAGMAADGAFYESISATGEFAAFDVQTGRLRWKIKTNAAVKMSAVERDGLLYFGDTSGVLYTVGARSGRVVERRSFPSFFSTSSPVIFGNTLYVANDQVVRALPLGMK